MINADNTRAFSMYTNPKMGEVYIDFETQAPKVLYRVLNKQGNVVCQNNNPVEKNTIKLQTLPLGIYTVQVISDKMVISKKFLRL
ncbi:T9SS type A sorting domain-containing protein [Aquimarina gracilis]|uniref:T9SS type A sorting domain-containing protein n=1 Tax=Aquimarina gracilis TaxID=874422 RepID=A0ABU5ZYE2_9FLAO|nr:T9SS type A sorting domain-containing protein [Aquimarina gracilis]MEB3346917.1 T9SS type A sorting domain-containing protein [Aquimarina gracilis]